MRMFLVLFLALSLARLPQTAHADSCNVSVVGIKSSRQYLPKSKLTCFSSKSQAKKGNYVPFDPAPSFTVEKANRFNDAGSSSTIKLFDNTFRTYLPGIKTSTSVDGLDFEKATDITGITAGVGETLSNPSALLKADGSILMLYELVTATGYRSIFRATSTTGTAFVVDPPTAVLAPEADEGGILSSPELVSVSASKLRVYFVVLNFIESAVSTDDGRTWKREGRVTISGLDTVQQTHPDILPIPGGFRLFLSTHFNTAGYTNLRIHSATSADGRKFIAEPGARVGVQNIIQLHVEPDAVTLADGRTRLYFAEASSITDNDFVLKSAISDFGGP